MSQEDDWFARNEIELLRQARREREREKREQASAESEARRQLHWMKCPRCGQDLAEETLGAVSVDRCSGCGGVFFERGEIETLLLQDREERKGLFRRLVGL